MRRRRKIRNTQRFAVVAAPALVLMAAATAMFADAGMLRTLSPYIPVLAVAGLVGVCLGLLSARMPAWLGSLVLAIVAIVSADFAFSLWVRLYNFVGDVLTDDRTMEEALTWLLLLIPGFIVLILGRRGASAIAVASAVFAGSILVLPDTTVRVPPLIAAGPPAGPLGRVVVHLMLDEHIGPNGIPSSIPGADEARKQMIDFYVEHGFRLYVNATSNYTVTERSLPALLWLDDSPPGESGEAAAFARWHEQTPWFAQLKRDGYRVMVYSVGGLYDLCSAANRTVIDTCRIYRSDAVDLNLWPGHRGRYLFAVLASRSIIAQKICRGFGGCPALTMNYTGSAAAALDRVAETLAGAEGDIAIFAHILLPHGPQALDAQCRPEPNPDLISSDEEQHFARYFEQIACTRLKVAAILDVLKARDALDRAIVIVHGDHGLRSESSRPDEQYLPSVSASTLFAVRAPGVTAGIDPRTGPVQELMPMVARDIVR